MRLEDDPMVIELCNKVCQTDYFVKGQTEMLHAAIYGGAQADINRARVAVLAAFEQNIDATIALARYAKGAGRKSNSLVK